MLYPLRNIKFLENKKFNAILTEKKKLDLLFRLLINPFLFGEKEDFPLCVLFVCSYILRHHSSTQKLMLHVSQDGQRTRISHLNLLLAFQVKD